MVSSKKKAPWGRARIQNLFRHENGSYYVRIHLNGKQVWKSTRGKRLEVAEQRIGTILEEARKRAGFVANPKDRMTVQDAIEHQERQLDDAPLINKEVGIEQLAHHDLRHFFATVCIESGADLPTVARWLGHTATCETSPPALPQQR